MKSIETICEYLLNGDNYLIIMHDSPDGDTVGSGYALCRALRAIGKRADCACGDRIPDKYDYMTDGIGDICTTYDHVIAVDVATVGLIRELGKRYAGRIELCIDHHDTNSLYAAHTYVRGDAAATCEIIYDVICGLGCEIQPEIAECLYTGISTDTGCFKYSNVTPRTHIIAAELMKTGIDTARINRIMFDTKSFEQLRVESMALEQMELLFGGKCVVIVLTQQMQELAPDDDLEGIKAITRQIKGVQIGVTMRERAQGEYKVSVRSNPPYSASDICGALGGGGHMYAAGCEINLPLDDAKRKLIAVISEVTGL